MNEGKKFKSYSNKIFSLIYEYNPDSVLSTALGTLHDSLMDNIGFGEWHGGLIPPLSDDSMSSLAFNLSYLIYKKKEWIE